MYKELSETMREDLNDWLLSRHGGEIKWIYELYINEYLNERMGDLNYKAYNEIRKHLLDTIIS